MASNSRRQIEGWLSKIDVKGNVIDVGGLFWPAKGRTKSWDVPWYVIQDIKKTRKGVVAEVVCDMNKPVPEEYKLMTKGQFDVVFCVEVLDHIWNPYQAFNNMSDFLKPGGMLYISANFMFPHHTGFDCARYTNVGIQKLLDETGFTMVECAARFAVDSALFDNLARESKVVYHRDHIGYMITAKKI